MSAASPTLLPAGVPEAFAASFRERGYGVARGVFSPEEVASIKASFDAIYAQCLEEYGARGGTFVKGNNRVWMGKAPEGSPPDGRFVRGVQWPSYTNPALDAVRTDPRLFQLLEPLLGRDIRQIINQMHWKQPGSKTSWRYHQDARARKPDDAFRELATSYVQMGIAVEHHTPATGGMRVMPFSHLPGKDYGLEELAKEMGLEGHGLSATEEQYGEMLRRAGVNPDDLAEVELAPGDVLAWGPYTIHGGGLNSTTPDPVTGARQTRAFYINGFAKASNCDRGHVAWLDGVAQPLGEPVLVQMDNFRETLAEGGRYFDADVTGLSDRDMERLKAVTTVRD
jgi:ectoine hydroxylase-related dioxygenase (phytanoyl-CoA dioxygenase family)